jgi:hypothetical protein
MAQTNEQMMRSLLLEWFDLTKSNYLFDMSGDGHERRRELKHLIGVCRPTDDEGDCASVLYAKLDWEKPKSDFLVGEQGHERHCPPGGYAMTTALDKASRIRALITNRQQQEGENSHDESND